MNGYSEASIVCGGNIGDPGFYLYLAKVKQKLQKILKTDREDLLIEKVERWNSVRVTFRLPPNSAEILRSLAEQRAEALRNLGIQSVKVGAGCSVSLATTQSSVACDGAAQQSSAGINCTGRNANGPNSASDGSCGDLIASDSLTSAGVTDSSSSSARFKRLDTRHDNMQDAPIMENSQPAQRHMVVRGVSHVEHSPSLSIQQNQLQQQNLLGYLLEEPDQAPPAAPQSVYHDYNQQQQFGTAAGHIPVHMQHQQQRFQQQPNQNAVISAWSHRVPPPHASAITASGQTVSEYYYRGHQQIQQQEAPLLLGHQHHQYSDNTSTAAMHSHRQAENAASMAYSSGTTTNNPAYHQNVNFGQHQFQQNPGNVSNSPLLVGLLQQNSPPPAQPPSSSSFMQPMTTPSSRSGNPINLTGYNNEHAADSSPSSWPSVFSTQTAGASEPMAKKQKRASATTKPKKATTAGNAKSTGGKKGASKRAAAALTADGVPSLELLTAASSSSSSLPADQRSGQNWQHLPSASSAALSTSPFNRDTSINSVIDSVLCNVTMSASSSDGSSAKAPAAVAEGKSRRSLESPAPQPKLSSASAGPLIGNTDETASPCSSSPASLASFPLSGKQRQQVGTIGSPQHLQHRHHTVLRSVSSSSSCSSPLVASAMLGGDGQCFVPPSHGGATLCASGSNIPAYGGYHDQPNHQLLRHHPYQQQQEIDAGIMGIRRQSMAGQMGPRLAHPSPAVTRFPTPSGLVNAPGQSLYSHQANYDLACHDSTSQLDTIAYSSAPSQTNVGKGRSPVATTVNGDMYSSPTHPATPAGARYPFYHNAEILQQEQYGDMNAWTMKARNDNGGNGTSASADTASFMISAKATATIATSACGLTSGGPDHDYLIAAPMQSTAAASAFSCIPGQQPQQVGNDFYSFTPPTSRPHGGYSYSTVAVRNDGEPAGRAFYNGGGDEQQMQEALVAQRGSAYAHQQSHPPMTNWEKQPQRVARHPQSWALHTTQQQYERQGATSAGGYDDDSVTQDVAGPMDGFPAAGAQLVPTPSSQHHGHGGMMHQHLQATSVDDPALSGQVPAR